LWTRITNNPDPVLEELANYLGITKKDVASSEYVMVGTGYEIREKILRIYNETGINYFVVSPKLDQLETFSKQVIQQITNNR
jgi:hypothetical protein